jgi:hypothetical protein
VKGGLPEANWDACEWNGAELCCSGGRVRDSSGEWPELWVDESVRFVQRHFWI